MRRSGFAVSRSEACWLRCTNSVSSQITAQELLKLQIIEGTVIGVGLAFLLISVYSYNADTDYRYHLEFEVQDDGQRDEH